MSNPLSGLLGQYGDSDDDSDEEMSRSSKMRTVLGKNAVAAPAAPPVAHEEAESAPATIHPAPVTHCPWSACYDEGSGFTYYWNQQTNAVTWEAPPEYLLALKLAQQQLTTQGSTEVSAEEWQLYQQALAEKQNKTVSKGSATSKHNKTLGRNAKNVKEHKVKKNGARKRPTSDSEDERIELITSYYHSDTEDDEESPAKKTPNKPNLPPTPASKQPAKPVKQPLKKQKTQTQPVEFGPPLPPNQEYIIPIGPEMPPELVLVESKPNSAEVKPEVSVEPSPEPTKENKSPLIIENDDEDVLLMKLKDKAKLLEKLGGEIPSELKEFIKDEQNSRGVSPAKIVDETSRDSKTTIDTNIDDLLDEIEKKELPKIKNTSNTNIDELLDEIEKKELPKVKTKVKIDMFGDDANFITQDKPKSARSSPLSSPRTSESGSQTPPKEEIKSLFPSSKAIIEETPPIPSLFPSAKNIVETETKVVGEKNEKLPLPLPEVVQLVTEKKGTNIYIMDQSEPIEKPIRKKLRISTSVLPEKKISEVPAYTTKYSQVVEGFSGERSGLGFSNNDDETEGPKKTIAYGKGLMFTKGETLNEDRKDDALEDSIELLEAKLKFLSQQQMYPLSPVQEMTIQMQTLIAAHRGSALALPYLRRWVSAACDALRRLEGSAAPAGWTCRFHRSEGRYEYVRDGDGLTQWEYPTAAGDDMDICTTPPPPPVEEKFQESPPPLPPAPPPLAASPPPPPSWGPQRVVTPPPPAWVDPLPATWADPLPPGVDPPLPPEPPKIEKKEIGDELLSFYNDIAEMEKQLPSADATSNCSSPERSQPSRAACEPTPAENDKNTTEKEKSKAEDKAEKAKKKSKVKISSLVGLKHKSVSSLVAKWQQVAEEIHSD